MFQEFKSTFTRRPGENPDRGLEFDAYRPKSHWKRNLAIVGALALAGAAVSEIVITNSKNRIAGERATSMCHNPKLLQQNFTVTGISYPVDDFCSPKTDPSIKRKVLETLDGSK